MSGDCAARNRGHVKGCIVHGPRAQPPRMCRKSKLRNCAAVRWRRRAAPLDAVKEGQISLQKTSQPSEPFYRAYISEQQSAHQARPRSLAPPIFPCGGARWLL